MVNTKSDRNDPLSSSVHDKGLKFKIPNPGKYDGTRDIHEHISNYLSSMFLKKTYEHVPNFIHDSWIRGQKLV